MKGGVEATRARLESVKETAVHGRSEDGLSYMHAFGLTQQLSLTLTCSKSMATRHPLSAELVQLTPSELFSSPCRRTWHGSCIDVFWT